MNQISFHHIQDWIYRYRWQLYFAVHAFVVIYLAILMQFDARGRLKDVPDILFLDYLFERLPIILKYLVAITHVLWIYIAPILTWRMRHVGKGNPALSWLAVFDLGLDLLHYASMYIGSL